MTTPEPLTVVIPLFNGRDHLARCLGSVAAQRLAPREVIVVDDGSTDGGGAFVVSEFPEVRVVHQTNQGVGAARNAGVDQATTDWVAFLDADDYWYPDHLEELAATIAGLPDADLVATGYQRWKAGDPIPASSPSGPRRRIPYFRAAAREIGVVCSSAVAVRRESFVRAGGFSSDRQGEDLTMWATIALHGPVGRSDTVTALYAQHGGGAMATGAPTAPSATVGPVSWDQISPSCVVVARALESGDHQVPPEDLELYLDSRVNAAIRAALLAGDRRGARRYRQLRTRPFRREFWTLHLAERAPDRLLRELRTRR